jgi:beta-galactosidase/beta-glucuronidase
MRFRNALIVLALSCCIGQAPAAQERQATPAVVNPPLASPLRETISLDGTWDFATDPDNTGEEQEWFRPGKPLPNKVSINVPACWEAQGIGGPGKSTPTTPEQSVRPLKGSYVGTAWYKKEVPIPRSWRGKQIWLKVGGVHAQGWFWVNGTYVAHVANYCGTYKYNITDCVRPGGTATVAVKVRNDVVSTKGLFSWIHRFHRIFEKVPLFTCIQLKS